MRRRGRRQKAEGSPIAEPASAPTAVPPTQPTQSNTPTPSSNAPVEASGAATRKRPRLVDDELRLRKAFQHVTPERLRDGDPDRHITRVQQERCDNGSCDTASRAEDGHCRDLRRAGERRRRHDDCRKSVEVRGTRQHAERGAERCSRREKRRRDARASTHDASGTCEPSPGCRTLPSSTTAATGCARCR